MTSMLSILPFVTMSGLILATVPAFSVSLDFRNHCALFTRVLIVIKCELVCQALDAEINGEAKKEEPPIVLKPKDEGVVVAEQANAPPLAMKPKQELMSASQIVNGQRGK